MFECVPTGHTVVRALDRPSRETVVDLFVVSRCIKLNYSQITDVVEWFISLDNGKENVRIHAKKVHRRVFTCRTCTCRIVSAWTLLKLL